MTPTPDPHQIEGAKFLAARKAALLADAPRVGKTGTSILAADYVMAQSVLTITTATARAQWGREWRAWGLPRSVHVQYGAAEPPPADAVVVGWHEFWKEPLHSALLKRRWGALIPDEAHYACNVLNGTRPTQRTVALYGKRGLGLIHNAEYVWPLTGTPMPNGAPDDLWPMLRGLAPERLGEYAEHDAFLDRYCVVRMTRYQGRATRRVTGGKNLDEFRERIDGFWLRRTQEDIGILPPVYTAYALDVPKLPAALADCEDAQLILDAAEAGDTKALEMHMGPLRRLTGAIKAHAIVEAVSEQLADRRIGKVVLMAWHSDVIDALCTGFAPFGVVALDGRTEARSRDQRVRQFQEDAATRVFVGQIQAAGEAVDLSAADELWFVEFSFLPKDMAQAALRVTHRTRKGRPIVRVCALAGSVDEAIVGILTPKVSTIRNVIREK